MRNVLFYVSLVLTFTFVGLSAIDDIFAGSYLKQAEESHLTPNEAHTKRMFVYHPKMLLIVER